MASYLSRKKASQNPKVANRRQYRCPICVKYNRNLKAKENLLQMRMNDFREIVSELQIGVKSTKKAEIVQVLVTHASNCQQ